MSLNLETKKVKKVNVKVVVKIGRKWLAFDSTFLHRFRFDSIHKSLQKTCHNSISGYLGDVFDDGVLESQVQLDQIVLQEVIEGSFGAYIPNDDRAVILLVQSQSNDAVQIRVVHLTNLC